MSKKIKINHVKAEQGLEVRKPVNVNHWSYSRGSDIIKGGIDLAVAKKLGVLPKEPTTTATIIGNTVDSMLLLDKIPENLVISEYDNFLTKVAKEWKAEKQAEGKSILTKKDWETVATVVERIKSHSLAMELLKGEGVIPQQKILATINGEEWVGYIDAIKYNGDEFKHIVDLKTTATFDRFKYEVNNNNYDLQSVVYDQIVGQEDVPFYWVVAETVPPYRVKIAQASEWTKEKGMEKFYKVVSEIEKFKARKGKDDLDRINFNQNNTIEEVEII